MVEGAPHTAKRSMINFCVHGVPPSPVYKGVEEGEGRPSTMALHGESYSHREKDSLLACSRRRSEGKGKEKRRKEGAPPLPLVQFGLGLGGHAACPRKPPSLSLKAQ